MDAFHYKILKPGELCWVLFASIEVPHYYMPIQCEVHNAYNYIPLRWSYTLRPVALYDEYALSIKYFIGKNFRMHNFDKNRIADRKIEIDTTYATDNKLIIRDFNLHYADEYLVALAPLVFETKEECLKSLKQFEIKLAEQFSNTLKLLSYRQRQYKTYTE